jgi:hypothetical protein
LKTTIDHFYGSEENIDLQLVKLKLDMEGSREVEAVEQGWALNNKKWYNCRSTRLRVNAYGDPKKVDGYEFTHVKRLSVEQLEQVCEVYTRFIELKGFTTLYELLPDDPRTSWVLATSDRIRAFTMFTEYDGALESNLTALDYSDPKKSLGKNIIGYEIQVAKSMGYDHLYIGPGYNTSACYKADFKGFEWWTGSEWSTDKDKYKSLCYRDSTIKTLEDLSAIYTEPTKSYVSEGASHADEREIQG